MEEEFEDDPNDDGIRDVSVLVVLEGTLPIGVDAAAAVLVCEGFLLSSPCKNSLKRLLNVL